MRARALLYFAVAGLVACGANSVSPSERSAIPATIAVSLAREPFDSHADHSRPWISPELAKSKVPSLFVSDPETADVYIYKLPSLKLLAKITGFSQPQGECSDNKGNVWIADTSARFVYELSHHGQLQNEFSDGVGFPVACAWDPKTGNLAVMDILGPSGTSGDVLVYAHATGSPQVYTNPNQYYYNFGGYDQNGNLFFDGRDQNGAFMLSELPSGAKTAQTIVVSGGMIYFPGMVEWNPKHRRLLVGDQSCGSVYASCVYAVAISAQQGTIKSQVSLENPNGGQLCDMVQGATYGNQIAGSDFNLCTGGSSATYLWPYPDGGEPLHGNDSVDSSPLGAAVSR